MILPGTLLSLLWCHVTPLCLDLSLVLVQDRYLQNNVIAETNEPSIFDCAASCQSIYGCRSFGFESGTHTCHLHIEDSVSALMDLVEREKWKHGDIHSFPSEVWGPCKDHTCTAGQRCSVHRVTKRSYCSKADLDLPDDHCPVLEETNAVSSGGQTVGSSRNYTCLEGYMDTESFLTSAVTTCRPNNTWSTLNLTCTGPFVKITLECGDKIVFEMIEEKILKNITGNTSSIIFWVKACMNSNFRLYDANENDYYGVVIGGYSNTKTEIRPPNRDWQFVREDDILSCTEFRPFWISWQDRHISVGRGVAVGSRVSIETEMSPNTYIKTVEYTCYINNEAVWYFLQQN